MSQRSEKPKLVALPPPAHQAIQEMTFMHSVAEYTAVENVEEGRGEEKS